MKKIQKIGKQRFRGWISLFKCLQLFKLVQSNIQNPLNFSSIQLNLKKKMYFMVNYDICMLFDLFIWDKYYFNIA